MTQPNGLSVDGNSIVISDATITFDNAFDAATGVATITITPAGGLGTLPALLQGVAGVPPVLTVGGVSTLAAGSDATVTFTQTSPGGPGIPSTYTVAFGIPVGATGSSSPTLIQDAQDLVNGAFGALQNLFTLVWNSGTSKFNPAPLPVAQTFYASSISSSSGTGAGPRTLSSITVPAQNYAWVPLPAASCVVAGTVNTQVNLQAFIGSTSGPQVGVGYGAAGTPTQTVALIPGVPTGSATSYGQVAAGVSATLMLCATQVAPTEDAWATASATTSYQVTAQPVAS